MQEVRIVPSGPDELFAVRDVEQENTRFTAAMGPGRVLGADGRPAVGALGVLADEVLGYALMASLAPGSWSISSEIWIDVVAEDLAETAVVGGVADVLQTGSFSAGRLLDEAGNTVAECRQRGRRVDPTAPAPLPDVSSHRSGATDFELGELFGVRRSGASAFDLDVTELLTNPSQQLHGGVSLAASEFAATAARVDNGSGLATSSVHIIHTRGVPLGASITFETTTRHAGRSLWVTDVVGRVGEKVCTVATVSAQ